MAEPKHDAPCLDCGRLNYVNRRGLCGPCYQKRRYVGRELPPSTQVRVEDYLDRVASLDPDACWPWPGFIDKQGYGYVKYRNVIKSAHRLAYERWVGPIPAGHEIDHLCHTRDPDCFAGNACEHRSCVNPRHLEPVPHSVNVGRTHRRLRDTCKKGHTLSSNNVRWEKGGRICLTCNRANQTARRRSRGIKPKVRLGSHCTQGHPLSGENLLVTSGRQVCRTCQNALRRAWRRKTSVKDRQLAERRRVLEADDHPLAPQRRGLVLELIGQGNDVADVAMQMGVTTVAIWAAARALPEFAAALDEVLPCSAGSASGTRSGYRAGCRCRGCRASNATAARMLLAKRQVR